MLLWFMELSLRGDLETFLFFVLEVALEFLETEDLGDLPMDLFDLSSL
jgi:hypothetical protein